jgi:hypothetical protein
MNSSGYELMLLSFLFGGQFGCPGGNTPDYIGRYAPGDNKTHIALSPFGEIGCHSFKSVGGFFKPGMHGTHQDPVF